MKIKALKHKLLALKAFFLAAFIVCLGSVYGQEKRFSFNRPKMGSPFSIILYDADSLHAHTIAEECFQLVDSLVNIYSDYIDSSELNQLSRRSGSGSFVKVSPALYDILRQSQKAYQLTEGTFDITMAPLVKLWRSARKLKTLPDAAAIAAKKKLVGFDNVKIDTVTQTVLLTTENMQLDLGGIAQGYIAQKVLSRLAMRAIKSALVDVSGDIAMGNPPPGKPGWTIGVNIPGKTEELQNKKLLLRNCTVSTSGDVYQFLEHEGKKYSHIIDPRTGYGVTSQRNVTVITDDATTADWLATACSILSIPKAKKLARKLGATLLIAEIRKGKLVYTATINTKRYLNE